jgi:hypothetical protein
MATTKYYRKQVELLLVWAMATTNPDLKAKLLARALEFLTLADGQREPGAAVGDETEAGHRHRHRLSALYRGSHERF